MSRLLWNILLAAIFLACAFGFVDFTAIAVFRQQHFAPGAEHPWDFYAEACLAFGLIALAAFLLMRAEPPRSRAWRKTANKANTSAKRIGRPRDGQKRS